MVAAVAEDVQEHPDAGGVHADLAHDAGLGERLDAAAVGVLDRPHEPAVAQLLVPVPRLHAQRASRRGGGAQAGDGRALPGRGGQELRARVQRADQLDVEPAAVGDAVDLLEQGRRPRRDAVERLGAEPAQLVAGQAHAYGEQAPVHVHHKGDALLLGTSERDAAGSWSALRRVVSSDIHVVCSIIARGTCPKGDVSNAYPLPGMRAIVGVDVGGTFTDVALIAEGRLVTAKVATTVADHSAGVIEGVRLALREAGLAAADVAQFGHGTTVATNAMLERRGARTAYVATRGFADVPALGRQARPHLYRPELAPPAPLAEVTAEVDERMGPAGVLRPLRPASVAAAARRLRRERVEAIAVCLLHAYADPSHERGRRRRAAIGAPGRPRRGLARGCGGVPRVRAGLDHDRGRVSGPGRRPLPAPPGRHGRGRGPAGSGRHAVERRRVRRRRGGGASGPAAPVGAGRRRRGRGGGGHPRRDQLRHGRHLDRRLPDPRRGRRPQRRAARGRPAAAAAAARHPHGRRGRGQHRLARPGRRAAGGAGERGRRPRPGLLRTRRRSADGHRREPRARPARPRRAACRRAAPRRRRGAPGAARRGGPVRRRPRRRRGRRGGRKRRDGARDRRRQRRAGPRSPRARAGGVRRRRAAACLRGGRQPGHARGGGAGRGRRALGARDRRGRAAPGRGRKRDAAAAGVSGCARRRAAAAAGRLGRGRVRAALPRPGARADRAAAAACEPGRGASTPATASATASTTRPPRSRS